jgi:hypothetical protein
MALHKHSQFGISALLVATTIFAVALTIVHGASPEDVVLLILLLVFVSGAVVCIVWTAHFSREKLQHVAVAFLAFNLINGAAWLFGNWALMFMEDGLQPRNEVSTMGHWLLAAHRFHAFTVIAIASASVTAYAAWKRNRVLLATTGAAVILVWLMVLGCGFLVASVHLIIVD